MSTDLKVSSMVCKCMFYRPEHNAKVGFGNMELNFESLEMQKCKYQRLELKELMRKMVSCV